VPAVLAVMQDSTTTDHISPAGDIARNSPAAKYLEERGVPRAEWNSYGSRRGNHEMMMRGTYANIRIKNLMLPGVEGGVTRSTFPAAKQWPSGMPPSAISRMARRSSCWRARNMAPVPAGTGRPRACQLQGVKRSHRREL
jgi:hypothetical protein